ncbi:hypothetical protein GGD81_000544 [Rhodobium orientis]|uniref:Molecular chaperone DnaJ n=1 Tax=Rhodobium orientis TaxID=34017 RepID=A0A327JFV6_9HYPH|nr:DnaJ domain-containing protein [Rhodobium orientis]MBB4301527.1 hypothetical protein [Rhodobium orientis]MBK5952224.1 molecular chaperone DnaJ [Rhodobium orientis]RAI24811.1 molecular chaperone DnaJ [Rhodobium orientis]
MARVFFFIAAILLILLGIRSLLYTNPAVLAKRLKLIGGMTLLGVAAFLGITGRWGFAIPVGAMGLSLLGVSGFSPFGGARPSGGQRSTVRSAALEMELDHDSGNMAGKVLAGRFSGQSLDDLSLADIAALWGELEDDGESRALLEAYLDRRHPDWREDLKADGDARHRSAPRSGGMSKEEAYQILGVSPGASPAEIREAHRRLMKRLHPDLGGSTFLASKLNEAKERLLGTHDSTQTHHS